MEERRFGECDTFFFFKLPDLLLGGQGDKDVAVGDDAGRLFRESIIVAEGFTEWLGNAGQMCEGPFVVYIGDDPVYPVLIRVEAIETSW